MSPSWALYHMTPDAVFYGTKPDVFTLHVFGSQCHVQVAPELQKKLDTHSIEDIFCGFQHNSKAYWIWIPEQWQFIASHDIIVYECVFQNTNNPAPSKRVPVISTLLQDPVSSKNTQNIPSLPIPASQPSCQSECVTQLSWIKQAANI